MTTKKFDSGRSMVEMLGTLAIIGVLSVGAIAGYSYGMDKYRANQTINDVMLRAVDILTYANRGTDPNTVGWPTTNPVGYPTSFVPDENNVYGIQVQNVPARVCKMVGDALQTMAEVYVENAERTDTTDDPCDSSEKSTMTFFFEPVVMTQTCDPECSSGEICRWGECVSEQIEVSKWLGDGDGTCTQSNNCGDDTTCPENQGCGPCAVCDNGKCNTYGYDGRDCRTNTVSDGICQFGACLPKGCDENNPCAGQNEYCASPHAYSNYSDCKGFYEGEKGVCVTADFKPYILAGKEYWISNTVRSFWDAEAACKTMGFDGLIGVEDLVVEWNGQVDYTKQYTITDLAKDASDQLGITYQYVWTSDDSADVCYAYIVSLNTGHIHPYERTDGKAFAICK